MGGGGGVIMEDPTPFLYKNNTKILDKKLLNYKPAFLKRSWQKTNTSEKRTNLIGQYFKMNFLRKILLNTNLPFKQKQLKRIATNDVVMIETKLISLENHFLV